jgi:hypothetical protein
MPGGRDKWWEVDDQTDLQVLANSVLEAYVEFGKPWLLQHTNLEKATQWAIKTRDYWLATRLSVALGEREQSERWLRQTLIDTPVSSQSAILESAAKYGLSTRSRM